MYMRRPTDTDLLEIARTMFLVTTLTKVDGTETFLIVAPNANTPAVLAFARRLLEVYGCVEEDGAINTDEVIDAGHVS
jgi:hypothetical protein